MIGFALSITGEGPLLINIAVFGATLSYVLMMLSHIVLRRREPDLERALPHTRRRGHLRSGPRARRARRAGHVPRRHHGGRHHRCASTPLFMAYFAFYTRHHLVASAPEEEFAALQAAESELR